MRARFAAAGWLWTLRGCCPLRPQAGMSRAYAAAADHTVPTLCTAERRGHVHSAVLRNCREYRAQFAAKFGVAFHLLLHLVARVHHGGVIFLAKLACDLRQGGVGEIARQVHRDLPRHGQALIAPLALELFLGDAVETGNLLFDE